MPSKLTQEEFIQRCKEKTGDRFSYENTVYDGFYTKVSVYCKEHETEFLSLPSSLMKGRGCALCTTVNKIASAPRKTTDGFIASARLIFGEAYDYSETSYTDRFTKVAIGCPVHGTWYAHAASHLRGKGCPRCGWEAGAAKSKKLSVEAIVSRASEVHQNKYVYHPETVGRVVDKMLITCPAHGDFWQNIGNHLAGVCCPSCSIHGFGLEQPGTLYVLSVKGAASFTGFGITNDPLTRIQAHIKNLGKNSLHIDDLQTFDMSIGKHVLEIEKEIKQTYKNSMIRVDVDGFKTESTTVPFHEVVAFVQNYIEQNKERYAA